MNYEKSFESNTINQSSRSFQRQNSASRSNNYEHKINDFLEFQNYTLGPMSGNLKIKLNPTKNLMVIL